MVSVKLWAGSMVELYNPISKYVVCMNASFLRLGASA